MTSQKRKCVSDINRAIVETFRDEYPENYNEIVNAIFVNSSNCEEAGVKRGQILRGGARCPKGTRKKCVANKKSKRTIYVGPRGGKYYVSNGKKVYLK